MNKKGQYYQPPEQRPDFPDVSPIFILGVIVFVVPFFGPVIHIKMPGWINAIGLILIFIGLVHTVGRRMLG